MVIHDYRNTLKEAAESIFAKELVAIGLVIGGFAEEEKFAELGNTLEDLQNSFNKIEEWSSRF